MNKNSFSMALFWQLARFGIVGLSAAVVHFSVVVLLVESHHMQPLIANIIGFCTAFQISYWGHRQWTFNGTTQKHTIAFPRLLLVSVLAFIANEGMFYLLMEQFALPYPVALILVLSILPLVVFVVNKLWVFE
jgi:putative flippase GtrA